jgi:hypothetical protein
MPGYPGRGGTPTAELWSWSGLSCSICTGLALSDLSDGLKQGGIKGSLVSSPLPGA